MIKGDKTNYVHIRISEKDKQELAYNAKKANTTMSEYILRCVKRKRIVICENFPDLIYHLARIGNNINQIAAVANTNKAISDERVDETKDLMQQCYNRMNDFVSFICEREDGEYIITDATRTEIIEEIANAVSAINKRLNEITSNKKEVKNGLR